MADIGNNSRLDTLRDRPKEDKTAIAGGVALFVVAVLIIGWGILFLRKIANEQPLEQYAPAEYDLGSLRGNVSPNNYYTDTRSREDSFYGGGGSSDPFGESRSGF